jgi:hypothetical protein
MTRRKLIGTSLLLLTLLGLCIYVNRDWFASEGIQIYHRNSPRSNSSGRGRGAAVSKASPVIFGFNRSFRLNSLKVVAVADLATNKYPHALWEMVSSSNSVPLRGFEYGGYIRGMHPKVPNARPEPLQPGETYRLLIQAGSLKGEHDFEATPKTP